MHDNSAPIIFTLLKAFARLCANLFVLFIFLAPLACQDSATEKSDPSAFKVGQGIDSNGLVVSGKHKTFQKTVQKADGSLKKVSIHLLDMIHIGPESYYSQIKDQLERITASSESALVLREGYYCNDSTGMNIIAVENPNYFKPKYLPGHGSKSLVEATIALSAFDEEDLIRLERSRFVKPSSCGDFTRSGANSISKVYESLAQDHGLVTQESIPHLFPPDTPSVKTDLDISVIAPHEKLVFGLYLSCVINEKCASKVGGFLHWLEEDHSLQAEAFRMVLHEIIHTSRNQNLIREITLQSKQEATDIIIPWGEGHMQVLEVEIRKLGYEQTEEIEMRIASCHEVVQNTLLSQLFETQCREEAARYSRASLCSTFKRIANDNQELLLSPPSYCD